MTSLIVTQSFHSFRMTLSQESFWKWGFHFLFRKLQIEIISFRRMQYWIN